MDCVAIALFAGITLWVAYSSRNDWELVREDCVALRVLILILLPFYGSDKLAGIAEKLISDPNRYWLRDITEFRRRIRVSYLTVVISFAVAIALADFLLGVKLSQIKWLGIMSTLLLTIAVFDQLG